jgi:hypothetical protein
MTDGKLFMRQERIVNRRPVDITVPNRRGPDTVSHKLAQVPGKTFLMKSVNHGVHPESEDENVPRCVPQDWSNIVRAPGRKICEQDECPDHSEELSG